jgi:H+/Cl- antiporter ClcA
MTLWTTGAGQIALPRMLVAGEFRTMLGFIIGSVVIGICVGFAIYFLYGMDRFKVTVSVNRMQSAVIVGACVAVVGFGFRWLGWLLTKLQPRAKHPSSLGRGPRQVAAK